MTHDHATDDVTMAATDDLRAVWLADEKAKWLTRKEAAFVLGSSVTTIDKLLASGAMQARREGRMVRIHLDDLRPKP